MSRAGTEVLKGMLRCHIAEVVDMMGILMEGILHKGNRGFTGSDVSSMSTDT